MALIDIHAHLTFKSFRKDLDEVIIRAKKRGIIGIINPSIDPKDFYKALELIEKYPNYVFLSIGAAPQMIDRKTFEEIVNIIENNFDKAVAIGEIGLDYYWVRDPSKRLMTIRFFEELAKIAIEKNKPIVIHNRDATKDVIRILDEVNADRVVFHAFMGNFDEAKEILEQGWYISIPTLIVRSQAHQNLVKKIDIDHIMLETDSPFLSPWPRTRNEPANVAESAKVISRIKNISYDRICEIITRNAIDFFELPIKI